MNKTKELFESFKGWWNTGNNSAIAKIIFIVIIIISGILLAVAFPDHSTTIGGVIGGFLFCWMLYAWVMSKQK